LYHIFTDTSKSAYTFSPLRHRVLNFSLSELAPQNTIVGNVNFVEGDHNIVYSIASGNKDNTFRIDIKNGVITVHDETQIDFEVKKKYTLTIKGSSTTLGQLITTVDVDILDENDNPPVFSEKQYSVSILENLKIGSQVIKLVATDLDSGANGMINYVFSNTEKHPFSLSVDGTLSVSDSLDLIRRNSIYYLYVKALDMGHPIRREAETLVEINVKSVNTHKPVLSKLKCDIFFNSNSKSINVFQLEAVDQDIGNLFTFSVEESNKDISINQTSGVILWKGGAGKKVAKLYAYAFDGLHKSNSMQLTIRTVQEESSVHCEPNPNFNTVQHLIEKRKLLPKPTKKPTTAQKPKSPLVFVKTPGNLVHISESAERNAVIGEFKALNPNVQSYGLVFYSITQGNEDGTFQVDLYNGTLFLRDHLNRESKLQYRLKVEASDGNGEKLSTDLHIKVDDINNTPPTFENGGKYEVQVKEEESIGHTLLTAKANKGDKDCALIGDCDFVYSLVSPSALFVINSKSGELKLKSVLSTQPYKEYYIEIQAADRKTTNPKYGYAVIHVVVIGFSNNPPICLSNEQRIEVSTSTPAGVVIGRVFAYDVDEGKAGKITFAVKNKDNIYFDDYFSLSRKSGLLTLKKDLSKQDKGIVFKIKVEVMDQGTPPQSTVCHLYKIIVDGIGVSQPSFLLSNYPIAASIPFNSSRGTFVSKLQAVLPGNETNQNIRYTLVDGNGIGLFTIDNVLGSIYVSDNTTVLPYYWLTVQAYIASDPSSYRNAHVLIQVHDKQQRKLFFNPSVYHVTLEYNEEPARTITQLYATDGSGRYDLKNVRFGIYAGDEKNRFAINNQGLLKSTQTLEVGLYRLNLTVSNPKNESFVSYGYVMVDIKAEYSEPPTFSGNIDFNSQIQVFETTSKGFSPPYLFQVLALNPNPEEAILYRNTFSGALTVDTLTGVVKTKSNLIAGETKYLNIKATNGAGVSSETFFSVLVGRRPKEKTSISFKEKK